MVCSICRQNGHSASSCTSEVLQQSVARIKAYWLGENMPEGWTDAVIKNWATTERIGLPHWRRIWSMLDGEFRNRGWWRIPLAERRENRVLQFLNPRPRGINGFKERIQNYVRPAQLPVAPPRPAPIPVPPRPLNRPLPVMRDPHAPNIDRDLLDLRRHMEGAIAIHHRLCIDVKSRHDNRYKIGIVMDAPDSNDYFVDGTCPICMEDITPETVLAFGCKHTFCGNCTVESVHNHSVRSISATCPVCRTPVTEVRFTPTTTPETFNKISAHLSFRMEL